MYYLKSNTGGTSFATIQDKKSLLWHQRLGHPLLGSLTALSVDCGFQLNKNLFDCCDICHQAKQTRSGFPFSDSKAQRPFGLIHCDLWGYHLLLAIVIIFCVPWMTSIELYGFTC